MESNILLKEFEFEDSRCKYYYDLMYKVIQFTFVAVVALAVCAFAKDTEQSDKCMILSLILPICIYIFGIMYAYNAYALSICGKRAELLHRKMIEEYFNDEDPEQSHNILTKYVIISICCVPFFMRFLSIFAKIGVRSKQ